MQDNDDDLTALSVSSPSVQAEAQQPEVAKAAAGISLGNAAASLADCEDTGHGKRQGQMLTLKCSCCRHFQFLGYPIR